MSYFYATTVRGLRLLLRGFFREIEVTGLENLPAAGGGILVSWHPNGLMDPGLILTHFPRPVVFGARDGLFRWPGLGQLMRAMGAVPIYRAQDRPSGAVPPEERQAANLRSLDALAGAVVGGRFSCLFPEGDSHDAPHLLELKTGAARFYYRARELSPEQQPVIIPVGLHYDAKRAFRSSVLITFHPPLPMPPMLQEVAPPEALRERSHQLTAEIERALREVVHATESWELHHLMHRVRKLVRAERAHRAGATLGKPGVVERTLGFARVWAGYAARLESHPEEVAVLRDRIGEYNADMRALGIEDHELDRTPERGGLLRVALLLLQVFLVFFLLPPLIVLGVVVNAPPALLLLLASQRFARRKKDVATIKLLLGVLILPASWLLVGGLAAVAHTHLHALWPMLPNSPLPAALSAVLLSILGGMVSLRYLRLTRETARALRVRLTRTRWRQTLARLRVERAALCDAILALVGDLSLPGAVGADGRIRPAPHEVR